MKLYPEAQLKSSPTNQKEGGTETDCYSHLKRERIGLDKSRKEVVTNGRGDPWERIQERTGPAYSNYNFT